MNPWKTLFFTLLTAVIIIGLLAGAVAVRDSYHNNDQSLTRDAKIERKMDCLIRLNRDMAASMKKEKEILTAFVVNQQDFLRNYSDHVAEINGVEVRQGIGTMRNTLDGVKAGIDALAVPSLGACLK